MDSRTETEALAINLLRDIDDCELTVIEQSLDVLYLGVVEEERIAINGLTLPPLRTKAFRTQRELYKISMQIREIKDEILKIGKDDLFTTEHLETLKNHDNWKLHQIPILRFARLHYVAKCIYNAFINKNQFTDMKFERYSFVNQLELQNEELKTKIKLLEEKVITLENQNVNSDKSYNVLDSLAQHQAPVGKTVPSLDLMFVIDNHSLGRQANVSSDILADVALSAINSCIAAIIKRNDTVGDEMSELEVS